MKKIDVLKILPFLTCISVIYVLFFGCSFDPNKKTYKEATELYENGEYQSAANIFAGLGEYKDAHEKEKQSLYAYAAECLENRNFDEAISVFSSIDGYTDSTNRKKEAENEKKYAAALEYMNSQEYSAAKEIFESLGDYKDSEDCIIKIIYMQANDIMDSDPDTAVDMLLPIKDYNENISKLITDLLINKALIYMQDELYEKAAYILEKISISETTNHQSSAYLLDLCNNYIKYNQALADFNAGNLDSAYTAFVELGNFLDCYSYVRYINAGKDVEAGKYGEAAQKYSTMPTAEFLDSDDLYEKYAYIYYDEQFQAGNRDFSKLPLLPLSEETETAVGHKWRTKRAEDLKTGISAAELEDYYGKNDTSLSPVNVTGLGIYVNDSFNKYGTDVLANRIIEDIPVFFLADSPEKVRYVINFTGSAVYYGTYSDGTLAFKTTTAVTIKDTVTGQILFSKSYTAEPPSEIAMEGDVYGVYDYLSHREEYGQSVYGQDILPVLNKLYE